MMTDPIADMLTRIRNGVGARLESVRMPSSRMKIRIAKILREEGYIKYFKVVRAGSVKRNPEKGSRKDSRPLAYNLLIIYLKYGPYGEQVISGLERLSRPGIRRYSPAGSIPRVLGGMGVTIMTTSRGVMSDIDARKRNIGGELICSVW